MSADSRLRTCFTLEHRGDIPLGCRGCTITSGVECQSCPANPGKVNTPKSQENRNERK